MERHGDARDLEGLGERAAALAAAWGATARTMTTVGQERAILRMFGVEGVDRVGHPLAAEVVDRYLGPDPRRLGGGIALPFAIAMAEYELTPGQLALEVAAGNVDLGLEAEMLADPAQHERARAVIAGLTRAAMARVDANRTARRELLALLGDPRRPRIGVSIGAPAIVDALDEAVAAIEAGIGLIRVEVPPSRELADQLARRGAHVEPWHAAPTSRGGLEAHDPAVPPTPTGSQRALAVMRSFLDEAGARHSGYIHLATDALALSAPDQAVVAAFERIDLVIADPLREIVSGRVDPDRALADHAFAHRLLVRAGTRLLVPAGPLVVAGDIAAGVPSDPATRSGRALALQLLAVSLAVHDGLPRDAVVVGALPEWIADEPSAPARAVAEIAVRRALFPGHPLAFIEPATSQDSGAGWQALVAALLPDAGDVDMLLCRPSDGFAARVKAIRASADIAAGIGRARAAAEPVGLAATHRDGVLAAAAETLAALESSGWRWLVDTPPGMAPSRLGADAVADRTSGVDWLDPATAAGV